MPTPVTCPRCKATTHLPDGWAAEGFTCPYCNQPVRVRPPARLRAAKRPPREEDAPRRWVAAVIVALVAGVSLALLVVAGLVYSAARRDAGGGGGDSGGPAPSRPATTTPPGPVTTEKKRIGPVEVTITGGEVGKVPLKDFTGEGESKEPQLMIRLSVANKSADRKIDYQVWHDSFFGHSSLTDEKGNRYKRINFGFGTRVVGAVERNASIYPGESLAEVLVFEVPVKAASVFMLELDADRVGEAGKFRFEIPKASIGRSGAD